MYKIAKGTTLLAVLAWLAPSPIYFALFRFDLYPAVVTLMFLLAVRRTAYITGAIWLGVAVALKGYAMFLLPRLLHIHDLPARLGRRDQNRSGGHCPDYSEAPRHPFIRRLGWSDRSI